MLHFTCMTEKRRWATRVVRRTDSRLAFPRQRQNKTVLFLSLSLINSIRFVSCPAFGPFFFLVALFTRSRHCTLLCQELVCWSRGVADQIRYRHRGERVTTEQGSRNRERRQIKVPRTGQHVQLRFLASCKRSRQTRKLPDGQRQYSSVSGDSAPSRSATANTQTTVGTRARPVESKRATAL